MSDFLNFLNTADHATLKKISGISNTLAENIIAARPFDSVDDLLIVHGMGKNLLTRMQSFAGAQENESESRAMIPVEEEALPAPIEKSQPAQESPVEKKPSFASRLGQALLNFIRALFRLIAMLIIIGGIGAAIYFSVPFIIDNLITPLQRNTANIGRLENEIATLQTQLDEMNSRVGELETNIEAHTASLAKLEEIQVTLEKEISDQNNSVMVALKREVMLTRSIETVARARLFLSQSNFGLAKADVQSARDLLAALQAETNNEVLLQVVSRLDLALGNLPDFPVVASGDLEIAWQILMTGEQTNLAAPTPTPAVIQTAIPKVSETLTPTQTVPVTVTPVTP